MVKHKRRLILVGLILVFAVTLLVGSAAHPVTVRSDVKPQTTCWCYWNPTLRQWCYKCCDAHGCYDLYCDPAGC